MADQEYSEDAYATEQYDGGNYGAADQGQEQNGGDDQNGDRISQSRQEDDDRKLFVGGLSWDTQTDDLRQYFSKYGEVADCIIKNDLVTGRSRGFGFVLFKEASSIDKVLAERPHNLHNRTIDPKRANPRGGREPIRKIFVGGLDPEVPEDEIRDHFSKYGKIEEIDLPYDKMKGQRRQFCFITFESEEVCDKVCEDAKQTIAGNEVDVKKATPKGEQSGRGGRGGYGYGGYGGGYGGRGRGRGRGGYGGGNWGNQGYGGGYGGYNNYNQGYGGGYGGGYGNYNDYYSQGYGGGYGGGYGDYNNYYNQGWGGYGGYDYSGWGYGQDQSQGDGGNQGGYGKARRGGGQHNYHPYKN